MKLKILIDVGCFLGLIRYIQKNLPVNNKLESILNFRICPAGVLARLVPTCLLLVTLSQKDNQLGQILFNSPAYTPFCYRTYGDKKESV